MIDTDDDQPCPHCHSTASIGAFDEYGDYCHECCECGARWYNEDISCL